MGGKEKEGRVGGRGKAKGGEKKGEKMWRGPESGLPRGPCWLSAGLPGKRCDLFTQTLESNLAYRVSYKMSPDFQPKQPKVVFPIIV